MAGLKWILVFAAVLVTAVDAGVTIETHKEGDGVNFPTVGKSVTVHYTGANLTVVPKKGNVWCG
jgi:hypothetical protein